MFVFIKSNRCIIITDVKAAEAAQSAYFDPNRPQMAYVPPPSYYVSFSFVYYCNIKYKSVHFKKF